MRRIIGFFSASLGSHARNINSPTFSLLTKCFTHTFVWAYFRCESFEIWNMLTLEKNVKSKTRRTVSFPYFTFIFFTTLFSLLIRFFNINVGTRTLKPVNNFQYKDLKPRNIITDPGLSPVRSKDESCQILCDRSFLLIFVFRGEYHKK